MIIFIAAKCKRVVIRNPLEEQEFLRVMKLHDPMATFCVRGIYYTSKYIKEYKIIMKRGPYTRRMHAI